MGQRTLLPWLALVFVFACRLAISAAGEKDILLPKPHIGPGKSLIECVQERKTIREFTGVELALEKLGELLWVGFGVNRPETGHRTTPSAMNSQEVDIYVALAKGVYVYDARAHALRWRQEGDLRGRVSGQDYSRKSGALLIYVADKSRLAKARPETRSFYAAFDAGCICQNVYLYCASAGLGTVVFDLDRPPVARALKLAEEQEIIMAQAVGVPK